ncbi:MAG: hypothetical protein ABS944_12900 [Solibacillus sp.]|uniref:hypothetical protein n=1 Tax=unclassified Solibacillus TaxID=2637870 RepID=UPI0030F6A088
MPFFQQYPRSGPYRQGPYNQGRQELPNFYSNQIRQEPSFYSNQGWQEQPNFYPNGGLQGNQQYYQNNGFQNSRFGNLPNHLNTIMGHAGTITNGVNMMRQLSSIMSLFR